MLTPVLSKEAFTALGAPQLVYVREITGAEVIAETPVEVVEAHALQPEQILFAVHGADGKRLAVTVDRATAFAAAVAHELAPVSVH